MPPIDEPLDLVVVAADPLLGVLVLLGAAVVVAAFPEVLAVGCAALEAEFDWGALWQPASANRTTEASTSFFIIISKKNCVGGATAPRPIISNAGAGECKLFLRYAFD